MLEVSSSLRLGLLSDVLLLQILGVSFFPEHQLPRQWLLACFQKWSWAHLIRLVPAMRLNLPKLLQFIL